MKVLDVKGLQNGIQTTLSDIEKVQGQISAVQRAIRGIVELEDAFKGEAGEAMRRFYDTVHQPFLIFLHQSLTDYSFLLERMQSAVQSFESNASGHVQQGFMETNVINGLNQLENVTRTLVNDVNRELDNVSDIVSVPKLNMGEFSENVQRGRSNVNDVLEQLHALDQAQTQALNEVEENLATMKQYINEMRTTFSGDASIPLFNPASALKMPTYATIWKSVYGTDGGVEEVEADPWYVKTLKGTGSVLKGAGTGIYNVGKDTVVGIYQTVTEPVDTAIALGNMVLHPIDTYKQIEASIVESYERDMINGDAESRASWTAYALGTAVTSVVGTKGAGTVTKTSVTATKTGVATVKNNLQHLHISELLPYSSKYQLAPVGAVPYNVVNGPMLRDQLLVKAKVVSKGIEKGKNIKDYRRTFFNEYPHLKGSVVVHHAVEQQILKRYPKLFTLEEIHALKNLRGIPKEINSSIHLSNIRVDWNRFYRNNPNPTKEDIINYMIELDKKYGDNFNPPVKR